MAIEICYQEDWANVSLGTYFAAWADEMYGVTHPSTTGNFNDNTYTVDSGLRTYNVDQYGISNTTTGYGFIAGTCEADGLHYTYNNSAPWLTTDPYHTFWGQLDSLSFGSSLSTSGGVISMSNPEVSIYGLDLSSAYAAGWSGQVHTLVSELQIGNVTGLLSLLDTLLAAIDPALSTSSTFAELEVAGVAYEGFDDCGCDSELVGVPDFVDDFALAA